MGALRWTARQSLRLAAAVGLLGLLVGIPAGLWRLVGWPLPRTVPTTWAGWVHLLNGEFPDAAVVNILTIALWLVWAAFGYSVALEWHAARHGRPARRLPAISPLQAVAALLVAALLAAPVAAVAASPPAPPPAVVQLHPGGPAAGAPVVLAVTSPNTGTAAARAAAVPVDSDRLPRFAVAAADGPLLVRVAGKQYTVTVARGDTLWDIAGRWLGDPHRWTEIYQLNADRYDDHGRMRGGDHIEPTWVLVLPADAQPPAGTPPTKPPAQPDPSAPPSAGPSQPTAPSPSPSAPSPSPAAPSAPAATTPPAVAPSAGNDGVAPPPATPPAATPPAAAVSGTGSAAASPSPTAYVPPSSRSPHQAQPPGVSLPGGSWVDLGLAAAIAAAAILVWKLRRRRSVPRPPSPDLRLDDPDLAPMPPVVAHVRRGLRRHGQPSTFDGDDPPPPDTGPTTDPEVLPDPAPVVPALQHPLIEVWPPAGLGLTGPGAVAAARGFLAAALAAGAHDEPDARGQVVIPAATLATLLGTEAVTVTDTPRLTVTTGLPEALDLLDAATLHRTRLVFDHEVDTVTALRDADPLEEPLPPLLLLADASTAHERARIAALLTQGQRLDIHGVLVGVWDDGNTAHVAADGSTTPAEPTVSRHGPHPADVGRLAVLDPTETADLLRTLAEAHTGAPQPAPPVENAAPTRNRPDSDQPASPDQEPAPDEETTAGARPAGADTTRPRRPDGPPPSDASMDDDGLGEGPQAATDEQMPESRQAPTGTPDRSTAGPGIPDDADHDPAVGGQSADDVDATEEAWPGPPSAGPGQASVCVLGPPRIDDLPPPTKAGDQPLRAKALEVLVYLIAVGGQAPQHRVIADVLPNALRSKAHHRLNTYVSNLRVSLARAGGKANYVAPPDAQYALNRDALDVDLWRLQAALAAADNAPDPATRTAALRQAVACYTGPLAESRDYEWVEPYREAVRQQAIDAHLALVAAVSDDDPGEAVTVLRTAVGHDPYNEPLYQQAMRLYARLGDVDGIRDLRRTLTRHMGEIDTEPGEDTLALADRLVTDLQRRPRGPTPLRGDAA